MDSVSNFAQLEGAAANFISALQAYANNKPDATSNLLSAGEGLTTATGNFMASNSQLEGMFGALGVPSSIISIGNDLIALKNATNSDQTTDAWLGLASDGLSMTSGLAAGVGELYPPIAPVALPLAIGTGWAGAAVSTAKLVYEQNGDAAAAQQSVSKGLSPVNASNGNVAMTIVPSSVLGNVPNLPVLNLPTYSGGSISVIFADPNDPNAIPATIQPSNTQNSTITFDLGDGVTRTGTVQYIATGGNYITTGVNPPVTGLDSNSAIVVPSDSVSSRSLPALNSNSSMIVTEADNSDSAEGFITDTSTVYSQSGSDQSSTTQATVYQNNQVIGTASQNADGTTTLQSTDPTTGGTYDMTLNAQATPVPQDNPSGTPQNTAPSLSYRFTEVGSPGIKSCHACFG